MNAEFHSYIRQAQARLLHLHQEAQNHRELKAAFLNDQPRPSSLFSRLFQRRRAQPGLKSHSA